MTHESERDDDGHIRGIVEFGFKAPGVRFAYPDCADCAKTRGVVKKT